MIKLKTEKILSKMMDLKLHESDLADYLSMSQSNFSRLIHNKIQLSVNRIVELSKILQLTPNDIIISRCGISITILKNADTPFKDKNEAKELLEKLSISNEVIRM